ncbi:MAG: hypothetical protein IJA69_01645 [Clostridia bacterium]|nr:hypothetical protein [Clostridia bacterium]
MALKKKLFYSISACCLIVATLVLGVWALGSVKYAMGGTVSFTAYGVNVEINNSAIVDGGIKIADKNAASGYFIYEEIPTNEQNQKLLLQDVSLDTKMTDEEVEAVEEGAIASWADLSLVQLYETKPFVLTFDMKNTTTFADELLNVSVDILIDDANVNNMAVRVYQLVTPATQDSEAVWDQLNYKTPTVAMGDAAKTVSIAQNQTKTFKVEFQAVTSEINANITDFEITFKMETSKAAS